MARKNYQVKTKTSEAWKLLHRELLSDASNSVHIPERKCSSKDDMSYSPTRGSYQLSLAEVEELRNHPDVEYVEIDTTLHPEFSFPMSNYINRFGTNVKNYRSLYEIDAPEVVKTSLMCTTGQSNQGTTDWVHVSPLSGNSPGMQYWDTLPLLKDYGVYPAVPADTTQPDPESTRNSTQLCESAFTINTSGFYQLEVSIDAAEGEVEVYTPTTNPTTVRYPLTGFNNYASANQKDVALNPRIEQNNPANHKFQVINLGWLEAWVGDKYHFKFEIKNGDFKNSWQESWDYNPGGLAWRLVRYPSSGGGTTTAIKKNDSALTTIPPISNPTAAEKNRTGYHLLRCKSNASNEWTNKSSDVKNSDVTYTNDGYDIDLIICDGSVWNGHPEFVTDSNDPPNYLPGNVLARHGKSGVLDLILDAPYYMDPNYFDADPSTRLEARWDGTPVPTEAAAISWWTNTSARSNEFMKDSDGNPIPGRDIQLSTSYFINYTRDRYCGQKHLPPTVDSSNDNNEHGTPVASLAYGKNFGWAFNCNKWAIQKNGAANRPAVFVKLFHQWKPDNVRLDAGLGKKDPTIMNNSWGSDMFWNNSIGLDSSGVNQNNADNFQNSAGTFEYRGTSGTYSAQVDGQGYTIPKFAISPNGSGASVGVWDGTEWDYNTNKHHYYDNKGFAHTLNTYFEPAVIPDTGAYNYGSLTAPSWLTNIGGSMGFHNQTNTDLREAIESGIHIVFAAGNNGHYITKPGDVDYNNKVDGKFTNRRNFPSQIADDPTTPAFVIGSMGNGMRNEWRMQADAPFKEGTTSEFDTKAEFIDPGSGYRLATNLASPTLGKWVDWNVNTEDYSDKGTGIDFYAPSTILAATDYIDDAAAYGSDWVSSPSIERIESHPTGGKYYNDRIFGGTSAAAPIASGLLACALQQNRKWTPSELKSALTEETGKISLEGDKFYKGYTPGSEPNDPKWLGSYSTMGSSVRVIKEYTGATNTIHGSLTSDSGISITRPINERFTISHQSPTVVHKVDIHGVREFLESDDNIPVEMSVSNGKYPVRISTSELNALNLYKYRFKLGSTNTSLQISTDEGTTWGDFQIEVVNGYFIVDEQRAYYSLNILNTDVLPNQTSNDPTYNIIPDNFTINEGSNLVTTLTSANVAEGTTVYWSLVGLSSADLQVGDLQGSDTVKANGSIGLITHQFANDSLTEGDEIFEIKLFSDSARNNLLKKVTLTLKDTSNASGTTTDPDPFTPGTSGYNNKTFPDNIKRTHTNNQTTVETAGPYFTGSVPIKFSDIGRYFKGLSVGSEVKASHYFRNTNPTATDPSVPNSTENEFESDKTTSKISGDTYPLEIFSGNGTNLSLKTFRGSIKRYYATVGSIDSVGGTVIKNYSMNRWDGSNGIDWDNRNHRDSTSRSDGNLTRNVEKKIFINATCYSDDIGTNGNVGSLVSGAFDKKPGAQLNEPTLSIHNSIIFVNGRIFGSGGYGGYRSSGSEGTSDPGKHGGTALKVKHTGSTTFVFVYKDAEIYGGGGGGESGAMGKSGSAGSCGESWTEYSTSSFCPISPGGGFVLQGCPSGWNSSGWSSGGSPCAFRTVTDPVTGETTQTVRAYSVSVSCSRDRSADYGSSTTPTPGIGGRGGNGKGYTQSRGNGEVGSQGNCPQCSAGDLSGGSCSTDGAQGGWGGDWGKPGEDTLGITGSGGNGGPAVCGSPFVLMGDINSTTVKGQKNGECDGTEQETPPIPKNDPPGITEFDYPTYARFSVDGMKLLVTADPNDSNSKCKFRLGTSHRDSESDAGVPFTSITIKDSQGNSKGTLSRGADRGILYFLDLELQYGVYEIHWNNVANSNTSTSGQTGYSGNGSDGVTLNSDRISTDKLQIKLKDRTSPEDDAEITVMNPVDYSGSSTWVRAYQTGRHGRSSATFPSAAIPWSGDMSEDPADGDAYLYPAHNRWWSNFMREFGVSPTVDQTLEYDPVTGNNQWHEETYNFTLTYAGRKSDSAIQISQSTTSLRLEMQSDNKAEVYWTSDTWTNNGARVVWTSDYHGHWEGSENYEINGVAIENQIANIPITWPANSASMDIQLRVRLQNNPNDQDGNPMATGPDVTINPMGIAWELKEGTKSLYNSTNLNGTGVFRPAQVGWKLTGAFSTLEASSTPLDRDWNQRMPQGDDTKDFDQPPRTVKGLDRIRLAPDHPVTPVSYTLKVNGKGTDEPAEETFEIL